MSGLGAFLFCGVIFAQSLKGINDTSETLFEANFAAEERLDTNVNKIYAKNLGNIITVYMNPKLITQQYNNNDYTFKEINNTIQTSPILGGKKININSKNVTIIGGNDITVNGENNNASILGGQKNELQQGKDNATPAILIGGNENTIGGEQEGNAIIGGQNNKIEDNTQHAQILGGKSNTISTNDVIVAGNKIDNARAGKSFVFSSNDGSEKFIPNSSNSFYLNTENGFGINKSTQGKGVETQGAINVGNIDITDTDCTSENIGLFGYFEQCLVGCTTGSANNEGKRNLMDAHTGCIEMCNNNSGHCIAPDPIIIPTTGSQCIGSIPNSENYKRCDDNTKKEITLKTLDVQFSSQFVDICPKPLNISANPCLYTCKSDATRIDGEGCQKNCTGVNGVTLKHGETIIAYKDTSFKCENQCNQNQATLKCNNGNLINQKNGESTTDYKYTSCTTTGSAGTCDSSFNLTKEQRDQHLTGNNYTECTGYVVDGPECKTYNMYKHLGTCPSGWTYQSDLGYCTKNCTRNGSSYTRGQTVIGWNAAEVTCTSTSSTCTSKQLTCQEDGSWGADETTYPYTQCNLIGETCEQHKLDSCPAHGHCSECFSYTANSPSQCLSGSIHYRLDRCDEGFTLINNKCEPECELPRGEKILYGETRIAFSKTDAECAETCNQNSEKFTCKEGGNLIGQNGGTTGTYRYKECVVHDVICEPNFDLTGTFSHGKFDTCIGYTTDGTSCTEFRAYDLTGCNDYYTYTGDTCKAKCRLPWDNTSQTSTLVDHGTKTGAYLALDETCGDKCTSVYTGIICNEGTRYYQANPTTKANIGAGGYRFKSCEQKVPNCTIYTKNNSNIYITFSGLSQPIIPHATGAMAPCLNYTYQVGTDICQHNFTNYTFKCDLSTDSNSDYARNPAGTACTRCEKPATWNSHTVRNSGTPQPNAVMVGIYDPNSNAACTYHCDEHSKRDGEKCAADCTLINSNGIDQDYKDGETTIGYTASSYRCSSDSVKCDSAQLKCKDGSWTLKSNGQYTSGYTYNYSKTISQTVTKTNSDPRRTLDHLDTNRGTVVDLGTEYFTDNNCACTAGNHRYKQTCADGYSRIQEGDSRRCHKDCTGTARTGSGMPSGTIKHGTTKTGYISPKTCTSNTIGQSCNSATLICSDGNLLIKSSGADGSAYNHAACVLSQSNPNSCDTSWTTTKPDSTIFTFDTCTRYTVQNSPYQCNSLNHYKITGCVSSDKVLVDGQCVDICSPSTYPGCTGGMEGNGTTGLTGYTCGSTACNCSSLGENYYWNNVRKLCELHNVDDACGKDPKHDICGDGREKIGSTSGNETDGYTWTCHTQRGNRTETCHEDGEPKDPITITLCPKYNREPEESKGCGPTRSNINWPIFTNLEYYVKDGGAVPTDLSITVPYTKYTLTDNGDGACAYGGSNGTDTISISKGNTEGYSTFHANTYAYGLPLGYNRFIAYRLFNTNETDRNLATNLGASFGGISLNKTEYYDSGKAQQYYFKLGSKSECPCPEQSCDYSCTGTIPDHAHKNNDITPSNNTTYSYSTDTSAPCTYSCDDGFYGLDVHGIDNTCRKIDHYEWEFQDGERTANLHSSPQTKASAIKPYGVVLYLYNGTTHPYIVDETNNHKAGRFDDGNWNQTHYRKLIGDYHISSDFDQISYSTTKLGDNDMRITLTDDHLNKFRYGIPVLTSNSKEIQGTIDFNRKFWHTEEIEVSFNSSQPSLTTLSPDDYKGQTKQLFADVIYARSAICSTEFSYGVLGDNPGGNSDCNQKMHCAIKASTLMKGGWSLIDIESVPNYYRSCNGSITGPSSHNTYSNISLKHNESTTKTKNNYKATISCNDGNLSITEIYLGGSSGGGGGCFLTGTQVLTNNGTKNIEDIQTGDIILSYNEKTKTNELDTVVRPFVFEDIDEELYELSINGNVLKVTHGHRFYVLRESDYQCSTFQWIAAEKLEIGDILMDYDGNYLTIDNIIHYPFKGTVYNMQIENNHNFYVDQGYLVHNAMAKTIENKEILK